MTMWDYMAANPFMAVFSLLTAAGLVLTALGTFSKAVVQICNAWLAASASKNGVSLLDIIRAANPDRKP